MGALRPRKEIHESPLIPNVLNIYAFIEVKLVEIRTYTELDSTRGDPIFLENTMRRQRSAVPFLKSISEACSSVAMSWFTFASKPSATVYPGPQAQDPKKVTLHSLNQKYISGKKLTMMTAYDFPTAAHVDKAGIDILLVGDSAGMVVHGYDTTLPLTLDMMLVHCRAAARGATRPFMVGDMPFGTYEVSTEQAVSTAVRILKMGEMDAVKVEGGGPGRLEAVQAIVRSGVACMGHIGLTPQSVSALGGFRPQAREAESALQLVRVAKDLEAAGAFAMVLECIPAAVAAAITNSVSIPTIGIGAGTDCSGQVLVFHDLLGMLSHPHHEQVTPKFCKQYAKVGLTISSALEQYKQDVENSVFPGKEYSPYKMPKAELDTFVRGLRELGLDTAAKSAEDASDASIKQKS